MHRKIMFGTAGIAGLMLIAACNQETSYNTPAAGNAPSDQTVQNDPAPGSRNETVSAAKDAVAGAVGTLSAEVTTTAQGFADAAVLGDMYEVQAGELAVMRASMPELKKFAQQMADDHTGSANRLKSVLMKSAPEIKPPTELDARHQGLLNDLKGATNEDFDGRYIAQQINAHNEAVILMRGYANDGDNADIKAFAAETLPKIQMHLDTINEIDRNYRAHEAQARNSGNSRTQTR